MTRRNLPTLLVIACLGLAGCGEDPAPEGPKPLDARAVATMPFEAPADGKLTPELLDRFTSVLQAQREQLEKDGNASALDPLPKDATPIQRKGRDKLLATARTRAMMAVAVPKSEYDWIKKAIVKARIAARGGSPDPATPEGANALTLADYEASYGGEIPTSL